MQIKVPIFLSSATCLALGSLLNAEVANACPVVTPKKVCCCCVLKPRPKPRPYVELGVGQAFNSQLDSDSFSIVDPTATDMIDSFKLIPQSRALPSDVLIGAGYTWSQLYPEKPAYLPYVSIGLEYQYTNLRDKKTHMNFNFGVSSRRSMRTDQRDSNAYYKFSQSSLLGTLKLDLYRWAYVMPYVKLGLGTTWNQVKPKGSFFVVPPSKIFLKITTPDSRNSTFSYSVGAGLDFPVNDNVWLSLGYQYNNFGRVSIGKPNLTALSGSPQDMQQVMKVNALLKPFHLSNFSTQSIQLTGRYLFA